MRGAMYRIEPDLYQVPFCRISIGGNGKSACHRLGIGMVDHVCVLSFILAAFCCFEKHLGFFPEFHSVAVHMCRIGNGIANPQSPVRVGCVFLYLEIGNGQGSLVCECKGIKIRIPVFGQNQRFCIIIGIILYQNPGNVVISFVTKKVTAGNRSCIKVSPAVF